MKTIYAISSGVYSDYKVLAVCANKKTALSWVKALNSEKDSWNSDARIEEISLIEDDEQPYHQHRVDLYQEWWDDGTVSDLRIEETDELAVGSSYGPIPSRPYVRFVRAPCHEGKGGRIEIRGRTKSAVLKVYSERRVIWEAAPKKFKQVNV